MSTKPHAIPIGVLMRAVSALKGVKDAPTGQPIQTSAWAAAMRSHNELALQLELLIAHQTAAVEMPA